MLFCVHDVLDTPPHIMSNIMRLKSDLGNIIEPDFGLLDGLVSLKVLTHRQLAKVRSADKTVYEISEAVLDLLETEDQCKMFVTALQETGQQHVVNLITKNGGQIRYDTIRDAILTCARKPT